MGSLDMKVKQVLFFLAVFFIMTALCWAGGSRDKDKGGSSPDGFFDAGTEITAQGAIGRMVVSSSGPLYTDENGRLITLAVLPPETEGSVPPYLPLYIQGLLNNNFRKFSAITIIDRQNLDKIMTEQDIAANGRFSDENFITIGNLTNAEYYLFGVIQKLSGERYSLQLSITHAGSGVKQAVFMRDGTLAQLEGNGTLINEASAELLGQMGVKLTEDGRRLLLAGNAQAVKAEAGLARGITAQAGGAEVEALFNYTQSLAFDPSQMEAISRLSILSSSISEGSISEKIVSDIMARNRWLEAFREAALFYNSHPPFEISFDPNLVQVGITDYVKNTANLGMRIALDPSEAGFAALNALLEGLEKTGKRSDWGFAGWPLLDLAPKTQGTVVFEGKRSFSYKVNVSLVNEKNKVLAKNAITLNTSAAGFSAGDTKVLPPGGVFEMLHFPNVKAEDLTPTLTIIIESVNGISSRELNASSYMKIDTADLEKRESEAENRREEAEQQAAAMKALTEREAAAKKAQKEREAAAKKARIRAWASTFANKAKRNEFEIMALYYSWIDDVWEFGMSGYYSPYPFTTIGAEGKFHCFLIEGSPGHESEFFAFGTFSPSVGIVFPLFGNTLIFANAMLTMGGFDGYEGILRDWMTPSFDVGLAISGKGEGSVNIKYRTTLYDGFNYSAIGVGLGLRF
jgi:hypothetical protein